MKLRKLTAIVAAFAIAAPSALSAAAADNTMKNALASVLTRIEVPSGLEEFDSSSYSDEDRTTYDFYWHDEDYNAGISVSADEKGRIRYYSYYRDDEYESSKVHIGKTKSQYIEAADGFVKKAFPELFTGDERLVLEKMPGNISQNNSLGVEYVREKNGMPVKDNTVFLTVQYTGTEFIVSYMYADIDYDTRFAEAAGKTLNDPVASYYTVYPLEKAYEYDWSVPVENEDMTPISLVYRFRDYESGFMDARTGEIVTEDTDDDTVYAEKDAGDQAASMEEDARNFKFSEAEQKELDNVASLKTNAFITNSVNEMGVFGKMPSADSFSRYVNKYDEDYSIYLSYYDEDKKNGINMTADGKSGKVQSFRNYDFSDYEEKTYRESDEKKADSAVAGFMEKSLPDILAQCDEPKREVAGREISYDYRQVVNGIRFSSNSVYMTYDMKRGIVNEYYNYWEDIDSSRFPDPTGIISDDEAIKAMNSITELVLGYVKSGGEYVPCYYVDEGYETVDAFTGKRIEYIYDDDEEYEYTDTNGHWAEGIIDSLAEYGIGFADEKFRPDEDITQADLIRLVLQAYGYYIYDQEDMYDSAVRRKLLTEDEIAPDSLIKREDAFVFIIKLMGYSKIASMDIFRAGFADDTEISPDKVGTLAILRGYGIVTGDDVSVRPQDNITRAETAALIYNYLTTEK